jgi:tetratricopeptide (TPR) repeat protein
VFFYYGVFANDINLKTAEDYYIKGKELLLKGEYQKANEAFKQSQALLDKIASYPVAAPAKDTIVSKEPEEEKTKPVAKTTGIIKMSAPLTEEEVLHKAQQACLNGDLDKALKLYKQAAELYSRNADIHYNLGVIYLKKEKYAQAAEQFRRAVIINRHDADAYYNLGVLYESFLSDPERALKYYKKYLKYSRDKADKQLVKKWIEHLKKQKVKGRQQF